MEASLTIIDGIVIIVVVLSALLAMAQGLTREFLWIGSIFFSVIIALYTTSSFTPIVTDIVDISPLIRIFPFDEDITGKLIVGMIIFIFSWILLSVLSRRLVHWVEGSAIGSVDRFMGLLFGIARGLFIVGIAYITYTYYTPRKDFNPLLKTSYTLPILDGTAFVIGKVSKHIIPDEYAISLRNHIRDHRNGKVQPKKEIPPSDTNEDDKKAAREVIRNITRDNLKNLNTKELDIILDTLKINNSKSNKNKDEVLTRP